VRAGRGALGKQRQARGARGRGILAAGEWACAALARAAATRTARRHRQALAAAAAVRSRGKTSLRPQQQEQRVQPDAIARRHSSTAGQLCSGSRRGAETQGWAVELHAHTVLDELPRRTGGQLQGARQSDPGEGAGLHGKVSTRTQTQLPSSARFACMLAVLTFDWFFQMSNVAFMIQ